MIGRSKLTVGTYLNIPRRFSAAQHLLALKVGDKASSSKVFTQSEVDRFAEISGDNNPLHSEQFATTTRFGKPIVHGVLALGLLSGILGTRLPGFGSVLISHEVTHKAPLFVGERINAEAEVIEISGRKVVMRMSCKTVDKLVLEGTCKLLVPRSVVGINIP